MCGQSTSSQSMNIPENTQHHVLWEHVCNLVACMEHNKEQQTTYQINQEGISLFLFKGVSSHLPIDVKKTTPSQ